MLEKRVIIAGSRKFNDYELLKKKCDYYLSNLKTKYKIIIISGHAKGADSLGEKYSNEMGYPCEIFPADWDKFGKMAGYKRNLEMAKIGDYLIAFKCAKTLNKGTEMMIRLAKEKGLNIREVYDTEGSK